MIDISRGINNCKSSRELDWKLKVSPSSLPVAQQFFSYKKFQYLKGTHKKYVEFACMSI